MEETKHIGQNIRNIRVLRGMKQKTFARELGIAQQNVSKMEKKKNLTDEQLEQAAKILQTTVETIKGFDENSIIQNNFLNEQAGYINQKINPLEKVVELYDNIIQSKDNEIKRLHDEIEEYKNREKTAKMNAPSQSLRNVDGEGKQAVQ
ncbi:MAG: helix-turn-helix protein [Flaviaesturariibacter sp.]|nr:helix-turn-helix protein [Flaviaesturariibacter sp.]